MLATRLVDAGPSASERKCPTSGSCPPSVSAIAPAAVDARARPSRLCFPSAAQTRRPSQQRAKSHDHATPVLRPPPVSTPAQLHRVHPPRPFSQPCRPRISSKESERSSFRCQPRDHSTTSSIAMSPSQHGRPRGQRPRSARPVVPPAQLNRQRLNLRKIDPWLTDSKSDGSYRPPIPREKETG